jgi:hypothetical protein
MPIEREFTSVSPTQEDEPACQARSVSRTHWMTSPSSITT